MTKYSDYLVRTKSNGNLVPADTTQSNRPYTFCIKLKQEVSATAKLRVSRRNDTTSSLNVTGIYNATQPSSPVNNPSIVSVPGASVNKTAFGTCLKSWANTNVPAIPISCAGASPSSATMLIVPVMKIAINDVEIGQWDDLCVQGFPSIISDLVTINLNNPAPSPYIVDGPFNIPQRHPIFNMSALRTIAAENPSAGVRIQIHYNGRLVEISPDFTDTFRAIGPTIANMPKFQIIGDELHFPYFTDLTRPNVPYHLQFRLSGIDPSTQQDFITYVDTVPSTASSFIDYGDGSYGFNVETMTTHTTPLYSHQNVFYLEEFSVNDPQKDMYYTLSTVGVSTTDPLSKMPPDRTHVLIPAGSTLQELCDLINQRTALYNRYSSFYTMPLLASIKNGLLMITNDSYVSLLTINFYNTNLSIYSGEPGAVSLGVPVTVTLPIAYDDVANEVIYQEFTGLSYTLAPMGLGGKFTTLANTGAEPYSRVMFYSSYSSIPYAEVTWYDPLQTNTTFFIDRPQAVTNYCFCLGQGDIVP